MSVLESFISLVFAHSLEEHLLPGVHVGNDYFFHGCAVTFHIYKSIHKLVGECSAFLASGSDPTH